VTSVQSLRVVAGPQIVFDLAEDGYSSMEVSLLKLPEVVDFAYCCFLVVQCRVELGLDSWFAYSPFSVV
jgi:hypothetical protein